MSGTIVGHGEANAMPGPGGSTTTGGAVSSISQGQLSSDIVRDSSAVDLYTCYVERITQHYHVGLNQFQIYFGFNAGLLVVSGFIAQPALTKYFDSPGTFKAPNSLGPAIVLASILGAIFSVAWLLVMNNSRKMQLHFNETIELLERRMLVHADEGFYTRLNKLYAPKTRVRGTDLIDMNRALPLVFAVLWCLVLFLVLRRI